MSLLAKLKHSTTTVDRRSGVQGYIVDKGERYAGAAAFGFIKGYYREKAMIRGIPVDLLAGLGLTLGSLVLNIGSRGMSGLAPHLNAVGDAGVMSYLGSMGASWGAKKSGRTVYVLNPGAKVPVIPPGLTAVGALPQAVAGAGAFLTPDQIAHYSAQR
jgi:hypothetical protein